MAGPGLDLEWYVAPAYELRRRDELPTRDRKLITGDERLKDLRHLVPVGTPQLVRPTREALEMVVQVLVKTRIPKLIAWYENDRFSRVNKLDQNEVSTLEKSVLMLATRIGMLSLAGDWSIKYPPKYLRHEPLSSWVRLAKIIQSMFFAIESGKRLEKNKEHWFGHTRLSVCLSYSSDGQVSMRLRPETKDAALIYHAAQMIAGGTTIQVCSHCGTPFPSGGVDSSPAKKRGDARFCSDKCRSAFHNKIRRTAARKTKS